jgi:hypothetical protein
VLGSGLFNTDKDEAGCDADGCKEGAGATIVARCNPAPVFEPSEAVFYSVPFFVERLVEVVLDFAVLLRRDARFDPFVDQALRNQSQS